MTNSIVEAVKEHAELNYGRDGWDFIVECWTDKEINLETIYCTTVLGAIKKMERIAKAQAERRREVQAEAW